MDVGFEPRGKGIGRTKTSALPTQGQRIKVDDIIHYSDLFHAESAKLQRGMNFGVGRNYSVFLMSLRKNAPKADAIDEATGTPIGTFTNTAAL